MSESVETLKETKERYELAIKELSGENSKLQKFNLFMTKMVDPQSKEYRTWTSRVRATAYGSATGVSVGMIVLDVLGCLGFCSGIVTSTTWGTAVAATESAIAL